jgi:hypothetical protein
LRHSHCSRANPDGGATSRPEFVVPTPIAAHGVATSGGASDYLLAGDSNLLSTTTGGDAGEASALTLSTPKRTFERARRITITGKLAPASGFEHVTISRQPTAAGSTGP